MKEIEWKGEVHNTLEIEVDRLHRLKQLQISCMVGNQMPIPCSGFSNLRE